MTQSLVPKDPRMAYARQLADEAKALVPGAARLADIAEELRTGELYRLLGYGTWDGFCTGYLGVSKRTANRWIADRAPLELGVGDSNRPKTKTAGQSVAAGHGVPVSESKALNFEEQIDPAEEAMPPEAYRSPAALALAAPHVPSASVDEAPAPPSLRDLTDSFFTLLDNLDPPEFYGSLTTARKARLRAWVCALNPAPKAPRTDEKAPRRPSGGYRTPPSVPGAVSAPYPVQRGAPARSLARPEVETTFKKGPA